MTRSHLLQTAAAIQAVALLVSTADAQDRSDVGIRSRQRLTILSANDGQAHLRMDSEGRLDTAHITQDSITVIHLGPDHPPRTKTIYGTVPNSIVSVPYLPVTRDGHYGFVSSRGFGRIAADPEDLLSVVDLSSPDLRVVQKVRIPRPGTGVMHPDGKRLIVPYPNGLLVFELSGDKLVLMKDNVMDFTPGSIDISPQGDRLVAVELDPTPGPGGFRTAKTVHLLSYGPNGAIEDRGEVGIRPGLPGFDRPFAPRFSPDGSRVLVLNGGGNGTKGKLDAVLSIDIGITRPIVTEALSQVADGMEAVAFHPSGRMAVIACLEETSARGVYSHLAVIDLSNQPMQLLYEVNIEPLPEGLEFSPDGTQLFVQSSIAHQVSVFEVDGFLLQRSPFVIRVGHGPSAMGIARTVDP